MKSEVILKQLGFAGQMENEAVKRIHMNETIKRRSLGLGKEEVYLVVDRI